MFPFFGLSDDNVVGMTRSKCFKLVNMKGLIKESVGSLLMGYCVFSFSSFSFVISDLLLLIRSTQMNDWQDSMQNI